MMRTTIGGLRTKNQRKDIKMIEYKGYTGEYEYDEEEKIFFGKLTNCEDLVTFEGKSVKEIQESFKDAVNDYIAWCKKYRKQEIDSVSNGEELFSLPQEASK